MSEVEGELEEERSKHRIDVQELEGMQESMLHDLSAREKEKAELSAEVERLEGEVQSMEASSRAAAGQHQVEKHGLEEKVSSLEKALAESCMI